MKKIISSILVVSLLDLFGCYSSQVVTKDEFIQNEHNRDIVVVTINKNQYEFDSEKYKVTMDSIIGSGRLTLQNGLETDKPFSGSIFLNDIVSIQAGKINWTVTLVSVALIVGIILFIFNNTQIHIFTKTAG
jgi:hypothetical protein